eukprot:scaffold2569_cov55-Phaeocystis_antarctica.AAC.3
MVARGEFAFLVAYSARECILHCQADHTTTLPHVTTLITLTAPPLLTRYMADPNNEGGVMLSPPVYAAVTWAP